MDAIKQKITGGAYDKPAKTVDGAMTTQDSADAHTIEGTSADPNAVGAAPIYEKGEQLGDMASKAGYKAEDTVKEQAQNAPDDVKDKMPGQAKEHLGVDK